MPDVWNGDRDPEDLTDLIATSISRDRLEREKFSVLASLYHKSESEDLTRCLQSILEQTMLPAQVVIVLDGPVHQNVHKVLDSFSPRLPLMIVSLKRNQGLGRALAAGMESCVHELVARVDTDDVSVSDRFEKQVLFLLARPEVSVVGGVMRENYIQGDLLICRDRPGAPTECNMKKWAQKRNPLNHPTVMFRKSAIDLVGGYMDCPFFEDYYLWVRLIASSAKIANLDAVLVETHITEDFFSRRGGLDYVRAERAFLKRLYELKLFGVRQIIVWIGLRMPLRVMPIALRKIIYIKLLRN